MFPIQPEQISKYVIENSNDGVWIIDAEMQTRFVNRRMAEMLGCSVDEMKDANLVEFVFEVDRDEILQKFELQKQGNKQEFDFRFQRKDGSAVWVRVSTCPVYDKDGKFTGILGMFIDITPHRQAERKEAEKILEKSEERYRAFIEQSSEGIWRFELEKPISASLPTDEQIRLAYKYGYLAECNDAMARQYGFDSAKDIIGARIGDLLVETDPKNYEFLRAFIESGYRLTEAESHEKDSQGNDLYFLNNFVGFIENGHLLRAWGTQLDITERKKIGETAAYLAAIVESSDDAIISLDLNGIITSWNKSAEKIFGYTPQEIVGKPLAILIPPERADEEASILEGIKKGERVEHYETVRRRKDGTDIDISLTVSPIRDESGRIIGASKIVRDITGRKRTQEILNENQMMLALAMQSSRMGIWWRDIPTDIVYWSEELEEIFGLEKGAFSKTENGFYDLVHEDDRQQIWAEVENAIEEHRNYVIEFRFYHADGSIRWMEGRGQAVYSDKGKPVRLYGIGIDITERKKAEESRAQLAAVVESSADAIYSYDLEGRIINWNKSAEKLYGYRKAEIIGQHITALTAPEYTDEPNRIINVIKTGESLIDFETRRKQKDGKNFDALITASPIRDVSGKPVAVSIILRDITEKKEAETALRRSEANLRDFLENGSVGMHWVDANGIIIWANRAELEMLGYSPEEYIGRSITEFHVDRDVINDILKRLSCGETLQNYEACLRHKDGSIRYGSISSNVLWEDGKFIHTRCFTRDITERKKAEEISERYHLLSKYVRDVILFLRSDGKIIEANQAATETYGYDHQTLLQMNIRDLRSPETLRILDRQLSKAAAGSVQFETVHRRKDGSSLPVEVSSNGIEIGGERMLVSIIRDITERRKAESESKQAQEAIIKAERKAAEEYQMLLERIVPLGQTLGTARDLISIYRAILEFVGTSMSCSAFFVSFYNARNKQRTAAYAWGEGGEVDISELPPMPLSEDGGPNSQAVFQKRTVIVNRYWDFMKTRPHVIVREDGINPMSSLVVPMMIKNEVTGTLEVQAHENEAFSKEQAVALEMAANLAAVAIENVRLLEVEAEARRLAEDANRAKDEFLSVLSHELRTPLNSMLGWVRMLQAGMLDEQRTKQAIEVIERNTRLQNSLIEDLLDVSRIISGKMRIEKEEVDLAAVTKNSCETLRPVAEEKNILFECSYEDDPLMIEGDAVRLQQVISNLVQNAIKFTSEGKINVGLKKVGDRARLIVKDTGIGIESDVLPHIFERFRQADASTRRTHSGLGLGLTIVSNLVELHSGSIKAESAGKGKGSTFVVEFPIAEKYLNKKDETGGETSVAENNSNLKGARILLVDDDAESIVPLEMLLEREKAEVVKVLSADEALAKLTEQPFHILVSDIGMPEMDGYDLIAKIRKLTSEQNAFLPAIALTAYTSNEDRRRALSAGFQMHFSKPFDFDELLSAIIQLYKGSR